MGYAKKLLVETARFTIRFGLLSGVLIGTAFLFASSWRDGAALCARLCHDAGCTHSQIALLEGLGLWALRGMWSAGGALIDRGLVTADFVWYQIANVSLYAMAAPATILLAWGGATKNLRGAVVAGLILGSAAMTLSWFFGMVEVYWWCVDATLWMSRVTGLSYLEVNALLFVVLQPLLVALPVLVWVIRLVLPAFRRRYNHLRGR